MTRNPITELIILDQSVPDKHLFYRQLKPSQKVIEIHGSTDGLVQLRKSLSDYQGLEALHIVSHAESGVLKLGNSRIDQNRLETELELFSSLNSALNVGADIHFYGCDLAAGEQGEAFLDIIQANTHADIAASNDLTGHESKGGDWDLEIRRGDIHSEQLFTQTALRDFSAVLADYTPPDFLYSWSAC